MLEKALQEVTKKALRSKLWEIMLIAVTGRQDKTHNGNGGLKRVDYFSTFIPACVCCVLNLSLTSKYSSCSQMLLHHSDFIICY